MGTRNKFQVIMATGQLSSSLPAGGGRFQPSGHHSSPGWYCHDLRRNPTRTDSAHHSTSCAVKSNLRRRIRCVAIGVLSPSGWWRSSRWLLPAVAGWGAGGWAGQPQWVVAVIAVAPSGSGGVGGWGLGWSAPVGGGGHRGGSFRQWRGGGLGAGLVSPSGWWRSSRWLLPAVAGWGAGGWAGQPQWVVAVIAVAPSGSGGVGGWGLGWSAPVGGGGHRGSSLRTLYPWRAIRERKP